MAIPTGIVDVSAAGIDYLLQQLQDDRTIVREHAAKQLQRLRSPAPKIIEAIDTALARERDSSVHSALETARDTLSKLMASVYLYDRATDLLIFPPICVCCGAPDATEEGKIFKSNSQKKVRFIWERSAHIELTVPACNPCKERLDRHTLGAGIVANLTGFAASGLLIFFGRVYLSWFILLSLVTWVWVYSAWLGVWFYRSIYHHPQGLTWQDLCVYDGATVGFTLPAFQEKFWRMNHS